MIDYNKLAIDFKQAANYALSEACKIADNGTCNMDGMFLTLPRSKEEKVTEAFRTAGLSGFKHKSRFHGTGYLINPPGVGQADKRCKAAEVMTDYFRKHGYDVTSWYQMD